MDQVRHKYSSVYVLFLSWEQDDLGVAKEIQELARILKTFYGFQVEGFSIPSEESDDALADTLSKFVLRYQSTKSLLIVYYAGHGILNASRLAHWCCHSANNSPRLKWYSHQRILENSTSDILLILDCCEPLGGGGHIRGATSKQVLAACGFSSEAAGVGNHSFSHALIQELQISVVRPFTIQELHHRLSTRLRTVLPDFGAQRRQNPILETLGEGGFPSPHIQLTSYTLFPLNLIAVMGMTGSGKSSLINRICGADVADVGQNQESMTKEVSHYATVIKGESVTLVDTPGFDDTYLTDRQVLERIAAYLFTHYRNGQKLTGLLYLRDINLEKMTGSARKNLAMFHKVCGEESFQNLILLTTKWDKPTDFRAKEQHESELISNFWSRMIRMGCPHPKRVGITVDPESGIVDTISDVIEPMLKFDPTWLQIQRELAQYKDLSHTTVGRFIDQRLCDTISDMKDNVESMRTQAAESKSQGVKADLIEEVEDEESKLKAATDDQEALKRDINDVMVSEAERRSKLLGYSAIGSLYDYANKLEGENSSFRFWPVALATTALYRGCEFIWMKQGKSKHLVQSARKKYPRASNVGEDD